MKYTGLMVLIAFLIGAAVPALAQEQGCPLGAVAEDAPVIKIGAAVSQTGTYEVEGGDVFNGYTLWAEWVNNEHGGVTVGGVCHRVEIIFYDDESSPDKVVELTQQLISNDGVQFILGPYSSGLTAAASEVSEAENVIMIASSAAGDELYARGFQNFFGVLTSGSDYTQSGIQLAASLGAKTAVIAYEDTAFPKSVADGAQQWLAENGIELLAIESYPEGTQDVTEMFIAFAEQHPDLFIGGGHFQDAVLFIETAKVVDFNPSAFLITVGPTSPQFVEELGADAEYVWGATQWEPSMAWQDDWFGTAQDYAARYEERFGEPATYFAAQATAAGEVLQMAIEAAGSLETDAVREALLALEVETFYGPINFDETGKNAAKPMATIQLQSGLPVIIAPQDVVTGTVIYPAPTWDARTP